MAYIENTFLKLRKVLEDPELTLFDKNVFTALVTFAGNGKVFPSREQICKRMGCRRKGSVSKAVRRLKETGYIDVRRRNRQSSFYEISGVSGKVNDKAKPGFVKAADVNFPKC